jgi:hypothetical protein
MRSGAFVPDDRWVDAQRRNRAAIESTGKTDQNLKNAMKNYDADSQPQKAVSR